MMVKKKKKEGRKRERNWKTGRSPIRVLSQSL
jgi:hypothetical protein